MSTIEIIHEETKQVGKTEIKLPFYYAAGKLGGSDFERKVRVGAIELGFIPNLQEMTFGEYVDLDSACANLYKDGIINGVVLFI